MNLKDLLKALVDELDRIHSTEFDWSKEFGMPYFVTASNGWQRNFTSCANQILGKIADLLLSNRGEDLINIEAKEYRNIVRQVIADMHAENEFNNFYDDAKKVAIKKLKTEVENRIVSDTKIYTHYFPAWTAGMDRQSPFCVGPVSFINVNNWIDMVDFSEHGKNYYLDDPEANRNWKEILKNALNFPHEKILINGLAASVYGAVEKCPSLVKITINNYEKNFSRKLARLVCKTALDSISLSNHA